MTGFTHHSILNESPNSALTNHKVHGCTDAGTTIGAGVGEWSTRPGPEDDVFSGRRGDEYARTKCQLSRCEHGWEDAGLLIQGKGRLERIDVHYRDRRD